MPELNVRRLGYALGAQITGVDLRRTLDDGTVAAVRQAWLDNLVLSFPGQDLTREEFVAFCSRFGKVDDNSKSNKVDAENRHILLLTNKAMNGRPWDGYKEGQLWHSDRSHSLRPTTGTFALSKEIPDVGGDTAFANQYMAYEALSPKLKEILEGLELIHDVTKRAGVKGREKRGAYNDAQVRNYPPVVHPVIRVHPETKRKALYVGQKNVAQFAGMTEEESQPLLDYLKEHGSRYEFVYRHRWSVNELVIWDNRCLLHLAPSDYDMQGQPRHLWRCSLDGPEVGRRYEPAQAETREAVAAG